MRSHRRLWVVLALLALLSPLALAVQQVTHAGTAWGEWGTEELRALLGYVPEGLRRTAGIWKAPLPDYALAGARQPSRVGPGLAYALSAVLGMAGCGAAVYLVGRWLVGRKP